MFKLHLLFIFWSFALGAGAMWAKMLLCPDGGGTGFCYGEGTGAYAFFFESLYSANEPNVATFLLFLPTGTGLLLALSKCSVLPFFSVSKMR